MEEREQGSKQSDIPGYTGNIDLDSRPIIENEDGTVSTVVSTSINEDGKEILIPTVRVDEDGTPIYMPIKDAVNWYHATGEHLGIYKDRHEATAMGKKISARQNKVIKSSATAGGSFILANPHIVNEGDVIDLPPEDRTPFKDYIDIPSKGSAKITIEDLPGVKNKLLQERKQLESKLEDIEYKESQGGSYKGDEEAKILKRIQEIDTQLGEE